MRRQIETAAVIEEIDEREGAKILEARGVIGEQHFAVLRMRVVVPAEPVIVEGEERDDQQRHENGERQDITGRETRARESNNALHEDNGVDRSYGCAGRTC